MIASWQAFSCNFRLQVRTIGKTAEKIFVLMICLCASAPLHGVVASSDEPVVAEGAKLVLLASGFETVEGPLVKGETFYFTDIPNQHIWTLDTKTLDKILLEEQTEGANGLAFDREGRLLMCKGAGKRLSRRERDGSETVVFKPVRQGVNGKEIPVGVNDVVVGKHGDIFITVPGAGCVYGLDPDGSRPRVVVSGLKGPNGLMLSPDETKLYVSEYRAQRLHVYDLEDGRGVNGKVFAEVKPESDYGCDGMTVDALGNLYCAGPHAVRVWNSEGELIDRIAVPESPTNCAFAGKGSQTLYITGRKAVYRIEMSVAGVR